MNLVLVLWLASPFVQAQEFPQPPHAPLIDFQMEGQWDGQMTSPSHGRFSLRLENTQNNVQGALFPIVYFEQAGKTYLTTTVLAHGNQIQLWGLSPTGSTKGEPIPFAEFGPYKADTSVAWARIGAAKHLAVLKKRRAPVVGEKLYPCTFKARAKIRGTYTSTKKIYLSTGREVEVDYRDRSQLATLLQLRVAADGSFSGRVNGQPNWQLAGSIQKGGTFESFSDRGTIKCAPVVQPEFGLFFKPWRQIYFPDNGFAIRQHIEKPETIKNSCFFGSKEAAMTYLQSRFGGADRSFAQEPAGIEVSYLTRQCLQWEGGRHGQCLKWSKPFPTKTLLENCDYDARADDER